MKGNLLGKNILYSFIGLVLSFIIYCIKYNDPSMTGWYLTFAIVPIILLPSINFLFISWYFKNWQNKFVLFIAVLTVPVITLIVYFFFVPEFVILLWTLSFLSVNAWTIKKLKMGIK